MESKNSNQEIYERLKIEYNYCLRKSKNEDDPENKNTLEKIDDIIECVENQCTDNQLSDFHNYYLKNKEEMDIKATPFDVVVMSAQKKRNEEKSKKLSLKK